MWKRDCGEIFVERLEVQHVESLVSYGTICWWRKYYTSMYTAAVGRAGCPDSRHLAGTWLTKRKKEFCEGEKRWQWQVLIVVVGTEATPCLLRMDRP